MTNKIKKSGEVVIPKPMLDALGLRPGMEVELEVTYGGLLVRKPGDAKALSGTFSSSGMAERLLEDRSNEPR